MLSSFKTSLHSHLESGLNQCAGCFMPIVFVNLAIKFSCKKIVGHILRPVSQAFRQAIKLAILLKTSTF
jgi:hypothetical protein